MSARCFATPASKRNVPERQYAKQKIHLHYMAGGDCTLAGIAMNVQFIQEYILDYDREIRNDEFESTMTFLARKDYFMERVKINNLMFGGNYPESLPNNISVAFDNIDAHTLASFISQEVLISTGAACHSGSAEISPVPKAIGADLRTAAGTVRISTGRYTTIEEIDHSVDVISNAVIKLS